MAAASHANRVDGVFVKSSEWRQTICENCKCSKSKQDISKTTGKKWRFELNPCDTTGCRLYYDGELLGLVASVNVLADASAPCPRLQITMYAHDIDVVIVGGKPSDE